MHKQYGQTAQSHSSQSDCLVLICIQSWYGCPLGPQRDWYGCPGGPKGLDIAAHWGPKGIDMATPWSTKGLDMATPWGPKGIDMAAPGALKGLIWLPTGAPKGLIWLPPGAPRALMIMDEWNLRQIDFWDAPSIQTKRLWPHLAGFWYVNTQYNSALEMHLTLTSIHNWWKEEIFYLYKNT